MNDVIGINGEMVVKLVWGGYVALTIIACTVCFTFFKTTGSLENVMKGPMLPVITVIIIVCAATLLTLLGLLKENTVSAIFGGIAGYVLGVIKKDKGD